MKREFTLKLSQTIPPEYIDTRKPIDEVSELLINAMKAAFNFDGKIEIIDTKEIEE